MKKLLLISLVTFFTVQLQAQMFVNGKPFNEIANGQYLRISIYSEFKYLVLSVDYGQLSNTIGIGDRLEDRKGKPYKFNSLIDGFNQLYSLGWELIPSIDEKEKDIFLFRRREGLVVN